MSNTEAYYYHEGSGNTPINVMPTNSIKCLQCDQYIPYHQFQNHHHLHIPLNLNSSSSQLQSKSKVRPISFKKLLNHETEEQIVIQSIVPQQLPKVDVKRKHAYHPNQARFHIDDLKINDCQTEISDKISLFPQQIGICYEENTENNSELEIYEQIMLSQQKATIENKKLKLYENEDLGKTLRDQYQNSQKKKIQIDQKTKLAYEIHNITSSNKENQKFEESPQINKLIIMKMNPKKPKQTYRIHTFSKQMKENSDFKPTLKNPSENNNFQCPECHGFYCSTCKSTIPPQFRPIPNDHENYQTTARSQFYKTKECEYCD